MLFTEKKQHYLYLIISKPPNKGFEIIFFANQSNTVIA